MIGLPDGGLVPRLHDQFSVQLFIHGYLLGIDTLIPADLNKIIG